MLRDITLGQYYPGESLVHKLDARIKIIATVAFIAAVFIVDNFYGFVIIMAALAAVIGISKVPLKFILRGIKPVFVIILFTFVLNLFMIRGEVLWSLGFLHITKQGLHTAVFLAIRLIFLIIGSSMLTLTTRPISLTDGIEKLLNPLKRFKVPAHELAMMMTIALRFIPTLLEETDRIMKAQTARGADFASGNILQRMKNMLPLLVPLFISAFRRADELAVAMEARCYRGGEGRTRMHELAYGGSDYAALALVLALAVGLAVLRWGKLCGL